MVKVAVAGGTGGVGRAIVEALKLQKKHEFVILSRKADPKLEAEIKVPIIEIDYSDPTSAQKTLDKHQIHTVISALSLQSPLHSDAQITLIRGAAASSHVKRFAPSEFGIPYQQKQAEQLHVVAFKFAAIAELEKTNLEYTLFSCGYFMDYWGMPKVKSYLKPFMIAIDIQNKVAGIPGSGNTPVAFTATKDVGSFVVLSLDLEKWNKRSLMVGDRKSWNQVLAYAEKATGAKFDTHYDSVEKLKTGQITELPSHVPAYPFFPKQHMQGMLSVFGLWFEDGTFNFDVSEGSYLNKLFPQVVPTTLSELIQEAWT